MRALKILGLDPSTTSTGLAFPNQTTMALKPKASLGTGIERLQWLRDSLQSILIEGRPDLVVLEDYVIGKKSFTHGTITTAEWGGVLRLLLRDLLIPVAFVNPATLRSYLQSKNGDGKTAGHSTMAAKTGRTWRTDDEADAWALASMGYLRFGMPWFEPVKSQIAAVGRVEWPTVIG